MAYRHAREFAPFDLEGAETFIDELPPDVLRVYVEVWEDQVWQFVYGDERCYVLRLLALVTRGRPFRIRSVDLTNPDGVTYPWATLS